MTTEVLPGAGARLAAAREAKGLSVLDVANQLKLSPRQIEALEAGDLARLPGDVFVRGFIRNYARLVDIDPEELLPTVPATAAKEITAPSTNLRFHTSGVRRWLLWPLLSLLALFFLVAALYAWLGGEDGAATSPQATATKQDEATPATPVNGLVPPAPEVLDAAPAPDAAPATMPGSEGGLAPMPAPAPATAPPAAPAPSGASAPSAVTPPPALASPASTPVSLPPQSPAPASATAAPAVSGLAFETLEDAWIQVVDGKGQRFAKLVTGGSRERFEGTPPFRLVVGNAHAVRLSYQGRPVDLKPFIGDKVARLTIGEDGAAAPGATPSAAGHATANAAAAARNPTLPR